MNSWEVLLVVYAAVLSSVIEQGLEKAAVWQPCSVAGLANVCGWEGSTLIPARHTCRKPGVNIMTWTAETWSCHPNFLAGPFHAVRDAACCHGWWIASGSFSSWPLCWENNGARVKAETCRGFMPPAWYLCLVRAQRGGRCSLPSESLMLTLHAGMNCQSYLAGICVLKLYVELWLGLSDYWAGALADATFFPVFFWSVSGLCSVPDWL